MLSGPPRRRRARPVADAPVEALLPHAEDLAKGWLLALLEQVPLDEAPAILAADLTREGPRVCEAVLRAIADDGDLRRLEPGGALTALAGRVGELAGASGPGASSRAVDALQAVLWSALRDELRRPDPDLVVELVERLTLVTEVLRAAVLRRGDGERGFGPPAVTGAPGSPAPVVSGASGPPAPVVSAVPGPPAPAIVTRPVPPALWVGALQEEIQRAAGAPLSVLLAELEDAGRFAAAPAGAEAGESFGDFTRALRRVARRQDILVRETEARAWLIARDTGRAGAMTLAVRIADAVGEGRSRHGAPPTASVGVAVLGEDGRTAAELIDAAEQARFTAEAGGLRVAGPAGDGVGDHE